MDKTEPVLTEFKAWLKKGKSEAPLKGLLGKAIDSILSRWSRLIRYLENGHITPDNNAAEKAIRPFVTGRKNWLFSGSSNGADAAAPFTASSRPPKHAGWMLTNIFGFFSKKSHTPVPRPITKRFFHKILPIDLLPIHSKTMDLSNRR